MPVFPHAKTIRTPRGIARCGWLTRTIAAGLWGMTAIAARAQTGDNYGADPTCQAATGAPCVNVEPSKFIGSIINWGFGLLGFVFLMLIIWGGVSWMTAGGNEEKVSKAKHQINAAIAGLVVVFISYALADAIVLMLSGATGT
ncbi:MAG: hypothetical protein PHI63_05975 [Patescibacteria group bacterium]|nr:hypothetical protein [Patescibacteria group bacterium]